MGEVWAAREITSGHEVALKTLRDAASAALFEREVVLQSSLAHRSVPRVLDRGVDADGTPWFAMERVQGRTFATVLDELRARRERRAPKADLASLLRAFARACRAVDHAHRRGVVHRDLKPENLMLGASGEVHIVDWGLAAHVGDRPDGAALIVGTPGYIAPELARGDGRPAHPSGDVYALGASLFELVALEPLYPQAHPLGRLTAALLDGDPLIGRVDPSDATWLAIAPVVRTAIARDPAARYASAEALAMAIELALTPSTRVARGRLGTTIGLAAAAALGWLSLTPFSSLLPPSWDRPAHGPQTITQAPDAGSGRPSA